VTGMRGGKRSLDTGWCKTCHADNLHHMIIMIIYIYIYIYYIYICYIYMYIIYIYIIHIYIILNIISICKYMYIVYMCILVYSCNGVESGAWTRDGVKPATLIIYII
jgi:hypothetical protein